MIDDESTRHASDFIVLGRNALAQESVGRVYEANPGLERYGPEGREHCLSDMVYHLSYLSEALAANNSAMFAHYAAWAKVMLEKRGIPAADLMLNLEALDFVLGRSAPQAVSDLTHAYLRAGIDAVTRCPLQDVSAIPDEGRNSGLARSYLDVLLRQERRQAARLVLDAVDSGVSIKEIYLDVLERTQQEIGRLWQANKISVAQEHYCSAVTQVLMSQLYPRILSGLRGGRKVIVSAIQGDLHEIGARMVADFFDMEGWESVYLGANTPMADLITMVRKEPQALLALSVTMTPHLTAMRRTIAAVRSEQQCAKARILVGGYVFNLVSDLWRTLGADGYAANAEQAVIVAARMVQE
jgi:methanogenic corrinoid protein MtbC1